MADDETVGSPEEQPAADRPEGLPDKFESLEALARSYSELERKLTEQGQEKSNLEAQLEDLYERQQALEQTRSQQQAYDPSTDPTLLAYEQAMETGDYRAALAIQAGLMQTIVQQTAAQQPQQTGSAHDYDAWAYVAEQTAIQQVGGPEEWAQYKDRVAEEAAQENFDGLSAQQAGNKLARLYKMVKADDVVNNQQTLAEQRSEAERQAKLDAQTTAGSSGRPPQPTRDEQATAAIIKAAREGSYESLIGGSG